MHMYFDKDTGTWVRLPIGWELHHPMVKTLVDQVEVSILSQGLGVILALWKRIMYFETTKVRGFKDMKKKSTRVWEKCFSVVQFGQNFNFFWSVRVKLGNFGHKVNWDIHLQTVEIQMRWLLMSLLIRIFTVCLFNLFFITILKI